MLNTRSLQQLLQKDMSRKEFLQTIGAILLGFIGLTAFLKNIDNFTQAQTKGKAETGYGKSPYGR